MILKIVHKTCYQYPKPVSRSYNEIRLCPHDNREQRCHDFLLEIAPHAPLFFYESEGGRVHHFNIYPPHPSLEITVSSTVEVHRENPFTALQLVLPDCHFYDLPEVMHQHYLFLQETDRTPALKECQEIAARLWARAEGRTASFLLLLTNWIYDNFTYLPGVTHVNTSLSAFLQQRAGVCQDFAHLMLAVCRHQGIPARYVSGYLYNGVQAALVGGDATHAWVECLLPYKNEHEAHWCGFDPTNRLLVHSHYIKVHHGSDYDDISPIKGVYWGRSGEKLQVEVRVEKMAT